MVLTFDPFREFDRLADRMLNAPGVSAAAAVAMPMDLYRSGEHFVLHCDLAGIDPGSINVDVDGRVLTIRAERSARTDADVQWVRRERVTGTFERRLTLGEGLDLAKIDATWNDGVLTVTIPVAETAKPRRIEIATGRAPALAPTEQQTIEGESKPSHQTTS
ncbi:Hsp20/alpha crystallin family protein [Actinoplanes sp. NEAU-A12]|uniref:Hsp20/alpha crystallin family protein n=1 Tax=Actinoplanes sandaracinus TaxID=3045177 RepID=A0ABT6WM93_9ACTN|nr:Hsp20/alpha crystallin family protein [Actinoplanes sandaracinus]MDI6100849.1 Hsp20/alpha crystallin family protein [Actinoplanes sandaracinus]